MSTRCGSCLSSNVALTSCRGSAILCAPQDRGDLSPAPMVHVTNLEEKVFQLLDQNERYIFIHAVNIQCYLVHLFQWTTLDLAWKGDS